MECTIADSPPQPPTSPATTAPATEPGIAVPPAVSPWADAPDLGTDLGTSTNGPVCPTCGRPRFCLRASAMLDSIALLEAVVQDLKQCVEEVLP